MSQKFPEIFTFTFPYLKLWTIQNIRSVFKNVYSEDLGVDRRIMLEWILGKYGGKVGIG
jgi:hypothetical protein